MQAYKTKSAVLSGTDFSEVRKKAFSIYLEIKSKSKRRPYLRSAYFKKDKVFLPLFWQHIWDKIKWQDRMRRLKFYSAGLELIRDSKFAPKSKENPNKSDEILHRFAGITKENFVFYVQIKEDKKSGRKDFISVFPEE
jgi:hypothetical protein